MRILTPILLKLGLYYPLRKLVYGLRNRGHSASEIFSEIYYKNGWKGKESRSGEGSSIKQTQVVINSLPGLLKKYRIRTVLDIPCGDFNWMSSVDLREIEYTGADIVAELIEANRMRFASSARSFTVLDLCGDRLQDADLIFCRDCMVHLSFLMLERVVANIRSSQASYLMATTFIDLKYNHDIATGDFRPINLRLPPFRFPEPLELLHENCTESGGAHADKALGLWRVTDIPRFYR